MVDDELRIEIYPHGYVEWRGSRRALVREALVPPTVRWPEADHDAEWSDDRFDWWLRRHAGEDIRGSCAECWALRRRAREHRGDGFAAARQHEARIAREEDARQLTPEARALRRRFVEARLDDRFQHLKARLIDAWNLRR